ncbi:MAG TPA: hypothetical protein VMF03_10840 [Steroidobacteraceae bacterium]|nr:hypothetical protein [Steroidobacteraceae bacterium]
MKSAALGPNPLEVWWLRLHGAALVGFLIVFGTVMPAHVVYGWRHRLNRGTGIAMLLVIGILALSGYGLYYLVDDQWRSAASTLHWLVGLCAMAVVVAHAILGKQSAHARLRSGGMARSELRRQHHPARHKVSE